jgi:hypothetical protein
MCWVEQRIEISGLLQGFPDAVNGSALQDLPQARDRSDIDEHSLKRLE